MEKKYWKKNKRQKFTDDFIKLLQPPEVKLETINDSKSNILVRNYRSGGKVFWGYYWFKNQTIYSWLGKWHENEFKVQDARIKAREIQSTYIDQGKDPRIEKAKEKIENYRNQLLEMKRLMFKQVIEKFIEAEMPRVEGVGRITCKSAKCMAYKLIGKKRVAKLKFFDDNKGNGNVSRKDENLRTWKEFWLINAKEKSNECVYDSLLGATYLEDIKTHKIKKYIFKFPTLPTRKDRKNAVSSVITFGINEDLFGDDPPINPAFNVHIPRSEQDITIRKNKTFGSETLRRVWAECELLKDKYPFQTQVVKLLSVSSLRKEEALKLTWDDINYADQVIEIKKGNSKIRINQDIDITPTVLKILNELKELREQYPWSQFLPWLFPSIKVRNKNLKNGSRPYFSKKFPHSSRLKDVKNCWNMVRIKAGLGKATVNIFKKTHHNIAKELVPDPYALIEITRHTNTEVLDKKYLNQNITKRRENALKVDQEYKKILFN